MFLGCVRVLNFDNSVTAQKELLERFSPAIIDFVVRGPSFRHWLNKKNRKEIIHALEPLKEHAITFLGSGDFHHISSLLLERFDRPISVIVFDHHPDWDRHPLRLACGSWVANILRRNNIKKVVLLGVSSEDIDGPALHSAAFEHLENDRVEIYPYCHASSKVFLRHIPDNVSLTLKKSARSTTIHWQELRSKNIQEFFSQLIARLPTRDVYLSIDKDCLKSDYSLTNWEEGLFDLDMVLGMLELAKKNLNIVGADIVGDYSPVKVKGVIKNIVTRLDHPKNFSAFQKSEALVNSINQRTNIRILETLLTP